MRVGKVGVLLYEFSIINKYNCAETVVGVVI